MLVPYFGKLPFPKRRYKLWGCIYVGNYNMEKCCESGAVKVVMMEMAAVAVEWW